VPENVYRIVLVYRGSGDLVTVFLLLKNGKEGFYVTGSIKREKES